VQDNTPDFQNKKSQDFAGSFCSIIQFSYGSYAPACSASSSTFAIGSPTGFVQAVQIYRDASIQGKRGILSWFSQYLINAKMGFAWAMAVIK